MKTRDLARACDGNWIAAFTALVPHVCGGVGGSRSFGSVEAVVTGLDRAYYNPVFATETDARPRDLVEAVEWIRAQGVAASVQLAEELSDRLGDVLRDLDLETDPWVTPGMALHPIPRSPRPPAELRLEPVAVRSFDDWHEGIAYGPNFKRVFGPRLVDDPAFRFVVGYASPLLGLPLLAVAVEFP